jgi:hypothetical protein
MNQQENLDLLNSNEEILDPEAFDEIPVGDDVENEIVESTHKSMEEILSEIDPDDFEEFDYCEFNGQSLKAISSRVFSRIPRYMKNAGIDNAEDLSIVNPKLGSFIKFGKTEINWAATLDEIVRDAFPEFSFKRFAINRADMFSVIINHLIIPIIKSKYSDSVTVDIRKLEQAFNDKLLYEMYRKKQATEG